MIVFINTFIQFVSIFFLFLKQKLLEIVIVAIFIRDYLSSLL